LTTFRVKDNLSLLHLLYGRDLSSVNRDLILKLIRDIHESIQIIQKTASKPFDELTHAEKSEMWYYIIVIVEAILILAQHIARRLYNLQPQTPIHSLKILADKKLLSNEASEELIKLFMLRNLIVLRYWIVDDKKIYENIKNNFKLIQSFIEAIKNVIGL